MVKKALSTIIVFVMLFSVLVPAKGAETMLMQEPATSAPFTDLDNVLWAKDAITGLAAAGIIDGYEDGTFRPDNNITRAEFAKLVCNSYNIPIGFFDHGSLPFSDVPEGKWYFNAVYSVNDSGLMNGYGGGSFRPEAFITREEMFIVCVRASNFHLFNKDSQETEAQLSHFVDGDTVSDWAKGYVATIINEGIVTGAPVADGFAINPKNPVTRAEAAVVLYRIIEGTDGDGNPTPSPTNSAPPENTPVVIKPTPDPTILAAVQKADLVIEAKVTGTGNHEERVDIDSSSYWIISYKVVTVSIIKTFKGQYTEIQLTFYEPDWSNMYKDGEIVLWGDSFPTQYATGQDVILFLDTSGTRIQGVNDQIFVSVPNINLDEFLKLYGLD